MRSCSTQWRDRAQAAGLAQFVLDDPVVALAGDRFVIRDETNLRTLGGGIVLNPLGRRVRKPLEFYRANLRMLRIHPAPTRSKR